ncbi:hypothetical protein EVG20_g6737, partial [Dentipellis fragilis]
LPIATGGTATLRIEADRTATTSAGYGNVGSDKWRLLVVNEISQVAHGTKATRLTSSMLPFNAQAGSSAPQNAQHVGSANGPTAQRPENASSGAGQSRQNQPRRVWSDSRCDMLSLEYEAVLAEMREVTQQFCDGLIDFYEHRELDARCMAKERAIRQAMREELDAEEPTTRELIEDWGYTGDEIARVESDLFNQNLLKAGNERRSTKYFLYRRRLARRH